MSFGEGGSTFTMQLVKNTYANGKYIIIVEPFYKYFMPENYDGILLASPNESLVLNYKSELDKTNCIKCNLEELSKTFCPFHFNNKRFKKMFCWQKFLRKTRR